MTADPHEDEPGSLGAIVPRWEWRILGEHVGAVDGRVAALAPERSEEGDELYLLSLQGDASVKIRGGLLDVKRLESVSADGLEQWRPVLKNAFPLGATDVATTPSAPTTASAAA